MYERARYVVLAVLAASGCASMRGESATASNPAAQQVETAQKQSEKQLQAAQDAQKKASEQAQKAAEAQRTVQEDQRKLQEDQAKARAEQAKAQQMQQQANALTAQATQQAQQSQRQAAQGLQTQSELAQRGHQVMAGQVLQANNDRVTVQPQGGGEPMTFRVTDQTQVRISGRRSDASELRQGEDARVAYQVSGTQPTAVTIQVVRTEPATGTGSETPGTGAGTSGSYGTGSTSSGSTDTGSSDTGTTGTGTENPGGPSNQ